MSDPNAVSASPPARPLVSVLVLTWNQGEFIGACVDSILAETYRPIEIVICDNGSPDDTWTRLEEIRKAHPAETISIFRNPPATPVTVGFNALLKRASGDLVCFFSGDDLFCGDRIAKQVAEFQARPDLQVIYGNGAFLGGRHDGGPVHDDEAFARAFGQPPEDVHRFVFAHRAVMIQTMMARRSLIEEVGGFDEEELADDWILNIRIFSRLDRREQYAYLPITAFLYRQHEGNAYRNFPRQSRLMIGVVEKYYHFPDRRRELAAMYWFQAHVGAMYGVSHLRLTIDYLRRALTLGPDPAKLAMFAARFALAPALRAARRLRTALGGKPAG